VLALPGLAGHACLGAWLQCASLAASSCQDALTSGTSFLRLDEMHLSQSALV
jgi:hypothetical protein